MNENTVLRSVRLVLASELHEVAPGLMVRRPFPSANLRDVDPFLMLDHMGPATLRPGEGSGVPAHPHRGFEAVSIIFEGYVEHRDSAGNHEVMGPGDVQWMTAGSGVIHSEMLQDAFREGGGTLHGVQLWVNLPRRDKMIAPRYQNIRAASIPVVETPGGRVRVIAGELLGERGPAETRTPLVAAHVVLEGDVRFEVPAEYNAMLYVLTGGVAAGEHRLREGEMCVFAPGGTALEFAATEPGSQVLLLAGEPLNEPVVAVGPFVMNTRLEIMQAFDDYSSGVMGTLREN